MGSVAIGYAGMMENMKGCRGMGGLVEGARVRWRDRAEELD